MNTTLTTTDGRRLAYSVTGPGDGAPVVFLGGTPGGRLVPEPAPGHFAGLGARVVGIDRPGYGGSDPQAGRRVGDAAADVVAVLDDLGIDRARVLGGSGGGPHALAVAVAAPERVVALAVQVGAVPLLPAEVAAMAEHNRRVHAVVGDRAALLALLGPVRDQMLGAGIASVLADVSDDDRAMLAARAAQMQEMLADALQHGAEGTAEDYHAIWGQDWGFTPAEVRVPVRWYHGEDDVMVPISAARRYAAELPDCAFTAWPGEGHLLRPARSAEIWATLLA